MERDVPQVRAWQSEGLTHEAMEIGFDILRALAFAKEPMSPIEIREKIRVRAESIS